MDADALMGAPAPDLGHSRLLERFDAHVDRFAAAGRVGTPDDLPFATLIRKARTSAGAFFSGDDLAI